MVGRVNRLIGSAARQIGKLAHYGEKAYLRVFRRGARRKPDKSLAEAAAVAGAADVATFPGNDSTGDENVATQAIKNGRRKEWTLADFPVDPLPGKTRFHDFPIDTRIMRGLAGLDFKYCTPIQANSLADALAGADLICRAQTGTGKTAVFLVSIFCRLLSEGAGRPKPGHPRALVIAPTRELVIQIVKDGRQIGAFSQLSIEAVYGGSDLRGQQERLESRAVDVIVATPGRLLDFLRRNILALESCGTLVIDEADRMLDMGFLPDVRRIISHMPDKGNRRTLLFSATINDDVRRLADQWCNKPLLKEAGEETVNVKRIEQRIYLTTENEKFMLLYNLVRSSADGRILVFENMKSDAARLTSRLQEHGVDCLLLTGDVPQNKRLTRLEAFRSGKQRILVATDVAGRGIHIDDIAIVVNYTLPEEPENYVHRIGRTGRAGASGVAVSFACEKGSFNIPVIEQYIGLTLPCVTPGEELLEPVPPATGKQRSTGNPERPRRARRRRPAGKARASGRPSSGG